jgi:hypothetical protein
MCSRGTVSGLRHTSPHCCDESVTEKRGKIGTTAPVPLSALGTHWCCRARACIGADETVPQIMRMRRPIIYMYVYIYTYIYIYSDLIRDLSDLMSPRVTARAFKRRQLAVRPGAVWPKSALLHPPAECGVHSSAEERLCRLSQTERAESVSEECS